MEQALYITAIVLFALGWAAVAAGALLFWRGGRRAALIPLLTGAAVIVVSAACLLSGLVSGPWAQRVEVREESGETVVSLRPKLLPQSALGPEMDRVRQEIVTQYENWEPISSISPSIWSGRFGTAGETEELLGIDLWDDPFLAGRADPAEGEGDGVPPWSVVVHGTDDGTITFVSVVWKGGTDGVYTLVEARLYFREWADSGENPEMEFGVDEVCPMANGCQAFLAEDEEWGRLTATFTRDGVLYGVVRQDDSPEGRETLYELLHSFG